MLRVIQHPRFLALRTASKLLLILLIIAPLHAAERRPNVVVFLADDAGYGDYGATGNEMVATPNIDRIAEEGVRVNPFFVAPLCAPTRAEFLTGRYHPRGGVYGVSLGHERLDVDEKTIADAFHAAGYATGAFGKWHNGSQWPYHPMARGFDTYFGHTSGHWGEYFDAPLEDEGRMVETSGYIVDVCTDRALAFIDANKDRPFFCYVPFTTPHSPWAAKEEDWNRWKDRPITQTATDSGEESPDVTRCALAMIENQDWNVGRVLDRLERHGLSDDTIVVYFTDNGPNSHRFNVGLKGKKGQLDEGGIRSPLFVRWPGELLAGRRVDQVSGAIDLLPTLLSLANVPRVGDKPLDGIDLSPQLRGAAVNQPDRALVTTWAGRVTVRTQTHRLDAGGALFDISNDPGQTTALNDREPELAQRLQNVATAFRREVLADAAARGQRGEVDPRPIGVGYREFPITMLPARDGQPHGNVRRSSAAPNCSYFVNWTSPDDRMTWSLDVVTTGQYRVVIDYTCPEPDAGSTIELSFNGSALRGKVTPGWDPPLDTDQDTLPRPDGESQMKPFKSLDLGVIELQQGRGELTLRAIDIPGHSVMDVRRVTLTLQR